MQLMHNGLKDLLLIPEYSKRAIAPIFDVEKK
ncbi:hypothetical protein Cyast_0713 [Cyanobacterium stanieri PCC 7202]|uniref:Uncharacterized protein n=1 Tax=Cyanobacterium stanieri (strain ATCC 29140 / PCC 7202) TaxID=292563 RepID=K9YJQ7_CYASC|nr:hypothetical protein Cyast_0713 [Cyanobacterium stanieri PCC 7202]